MEIIVTSKILTTGLHYFQKGSWIQIMYQNMSYNSYSVSSSTNQPTQTGNQYPWHTWFNIASSVKKNNTYKEVLILELFHIFLYFILFFVITGIFEIVQLPEKWDEIERINISPWIIHHIAAEQHRHLCLWGSCCNILFKYLPHTVTAAKEISEESKSKSVALSVYIAVHRKTKNTFRVLIPLSGNAMGYYSQ